MALSTRPDLSASSSPKFTSSTQLIKQMLQPTVLQSLASIKPIQILPLERYSVAPKFTSYEAATPQPVEKISPDLWPVIFDYLDTASSEKMITACKFTANMANYVGIGEKLSSEKAAKEISKEIKIMLESAILPTKNIHCSSSSKALDSILSINNTNNVAIKVVCPEEGLIYSEPSGQGFVMRR